MEVKRHIRIAVVGTGWVTEHRHLPALQKQPGVILQRLIGLQPERINALAKRFRVREQWVVGERGWTEAFAGCDAAIIGTDPVSHFEVAKAALEAGKHVLMEKPLVLEPAQGAALIELAEARGVRFAVVHNFQFSRATQALEAALSAGKLGALTSLEAIQYSNEKRRLPAWYETLPGGLFYDEAPHLLYLLERFGGELDLLDASVERLPGRQTPAAVQAVFATERAGRAVLRMNFRAGLSEWFLVLHGSQATGILDIFRDIFFILPNDGRHTPSLILRTSLRAFAGHFRGTLMSGIRVLRRDYLCGNEEVMALFLAALRQGNDLGRLDARQGLAINQMQHRILREARVL